MEEIGIPSQEKEKVENERSTYLKFDRNKNCHIMGDNELRYEFL